MKKVSVLGSTGSIGRKAVELLLQRKNEYEVEGLTAHSNFTLLAKQAKLLNAKYVDIADEKLYRNLKENLENTNIKIERNIASIPVDLSIISIVGIAGLEPVIQTIECGTKAIALANKESIVCGGKLLLKKAKKNNVEIIPVDSEHNAIFQVLQNNGGKHVEKITLTASGGPFLNYSLEQLKNVTINEALSHPTWNMGKKISIDSATMMNKALEIIEAHHLFANVIEVVVHPESIIHGIVTYKDGFNFAVLAQPNMTIPISYAISWPERSSLNYSLNLTKHEKLTFQKVDNARFPAVNLSMEVLKSSAPNTNSIVLNAANEIAVNAFLMSKIGFLDITKVVSLTLEKINNTTEINSLNNIINTDCSSRTIAKKIIESKACIQ